MTLTLDSPRRSTTTPDPYRTWLGVTGTRRPPNAYELLGLPNLESNPERIRQAIQAKRRAVESRRAEADEAMWQQINAEVEEAARTLQTSGDKAILDAAIRRRDANGIAASDLPADAGSRLIVCSGCRETNAGGRRFCAKCGESLWARCLRCGAVSAASERFCGKCGVNFAEVVHERVHELEQTLAAAHTAIGEYDFVRARSVLFPLVSLVDPRFDAQIESAVQLLEQVREAERTNQSQHAEAAEEARELLAKNSYEAVVAVLSEIPERLRSEPVRELLERAESARREVLGLSGEIREAVAAGQTLDLIPKIERLLVLKPNHAEARKLFDQVRDAICQASRKRLARHAYAEALELLNKLPATAHNAEVETLLDQATELAWLLAAVRESPLADRAAVAIGERLVKAAPKNELATKLVGELKTRAASKPRDRRVAVVSWADPPTNTHVGPAMEWLGGSRRLAGTERLAAWNEYPGRFFVAAGLALQGLGRSALQLNLQPEVKPRGMLSRFGLGRRKSEPRAAWGVDIGDSSLKAIRLVFVEETATVEATDAVLIEHARPLSRAGGNLDRRTLVQQSLAKFFTGREVEDQRLCFGLPGMKVYAKSLNLPVAAEDDKFMDVLQFEVRNRVPFPLDELHWAHEPLPSPAGATQHPVLIVAAKRYDVQDLTSVCDELQVRIDVLQSECVALHNFAVFEHFGERPAVRPAEDPAVALLDVGSEAANFVVSSVCSHWSRSVRIGVDSFNQALVKGLQLTQDQAEKLRREPWRARRLSGLYGELESAFRDLTAELQRSLESLGQECPHLRVKRLLGLGGGFATHGLLRYLRTGKC